MKKIVFFLLGNLVPQVILASLFLWLAAVIEKDAFANLALLDSIFQGLLVILLFGMDKAMERFSFTESSPKYTEELLVTASLACLGIGTAISLIYFFVDYLLHTNPPAGLQRNWVYVLFASATVAAVFQLFISYIYVRSEVKSFAVLRAMRALIFSLVLLMVVFSNSSVVFGKLIADFLACVTPLIFLILISNRPLPKIQFRLKIIKDIFPYSAPFVLALIASFSLNHVDRFLIANYIDLDSLANYSLSQRVVGMITLVASSVALIVPPIFYRNIKIDSVKVYLAISEVMGLCFWLCIIASCILPIALNFFYGAKYSVALSYIPLLLVGVYLSVAVSCSTALCLLIDNRSALNMSTGILAALTSVGLNLFLLPIIGVYGSIIAYLVSISGLYGLQYFIAKKRFKDLPAFYRQALLLFVSCATLSYLIGLEANLTPSILYLLIASAIVATVFMLLNLKNASITNV